MSPIKHNGEGMAEKLREMNYDVNFVENQSGREMTDVLDDFSSMVLQSLKPLQAVIYYTGHAGAKRGAAATDPHAQLQGVDGEITDITVSNLFFF